MENNLIYNYSFLSESFKILDKCSWWVQNAYQSFSGAKSLLNDLDSVASQFENGEKNSKDILIKKAKNFCNKEEKDWRGKSGQENDVNQREKERQVFAFFAELKTAKELKEKGYQEIQFIEEQTIKMPDISAKKDGQIFYIEVKRIQNPREEDEAFRSTGNHSGDVSADFREALKKKIGDFICDAKEKFECIDGNVKLNTEQKILVLDFAPGLDARLNGNNFDPDLEEVFGMNFFSNLEHAYDIQIWTRKYF